MMYEIERMTFDEVQGLLNKGVSIVIVPVGATEQHGYGAPLATDTYAAELVSKRVAEKLECFYAPVLPYGSATESRGYPGTITLTPLTLALVIKEIGNSLASEGFTNIVFISGHGGNAGPLRTGAREVKDTHPECTVIHGSCWSGIGKSPRYNELWEKWGKGLASRAFFGHGGPIELAIDMVVNEKDVKLDKIRGPGKLTHPDKVIANEANSLYVESDMMEMAGPPGAYAGFAEVTPELGEDIIEAGAVQLAEDIKKAIQYFGAEGRKVHLPGEFAQPRKDGKA
jgi:creatinine amidohydrolase/Fe(II)-dependent formamide hydrolase-like protein